MAQVNCFFVNFIMSCIDLVVFYLHLQISKFLQDFFIVENISRHTFLNSTYFFEWYQYKKVQRARRGQKGKESACKKRVLST